MTLLKILQVTSKFILRGVLLFVIGSANAQPSSWQDKVEIPYFIENRGQIRDQYSNVRPDIQFSFRYRGLTLYVGASKLHYQFSKQLLDGVDSNDDCSQTIQPTLKKEYAPRYDAASLTSYRMDVELLGADKNARCVADWQKDYFENYYLPTCPAGILHAQAFQRLTYKNVYAGIDWVLCWKNGNLEQEFVLHPGANPSDIKLRYAGQTELFKNETGDLIAITPMGVIREHIPIIFYSDGSAKPSHFMLHNDVLSYDFAVGANAVCIDPVIDWATYYGPDTTTTYFYALASDPSANIYACGLTYSALSGTIATTGAFQDTYSGASDAFLVKFDSSGHRLWGTYYGGAGGEWATAVGLDSTGNIYLGGSTNSTTAMATPGADIPTFDGGLWAGFVAKFNHLGMRQWGTYLGGTPGSAFDLEVSSVFCDTIGHVYVTGTTDDTINVATPGSFKSGKYYGMDTIDDYIVQYDTLLGHKIWGTYYGGPRNELSGVGCTDGRNVYIAGYTNSDTSTGRAPVGTGIPTAGCYQALYGGNTDAFLAKFDAFGARDWGTYYGGSAPEDVGGLAYSSGFIYLLGSTASDTAMTSSGCWQPVRGGGTDAFVAKFNADIGFRVWGTYYGGPGEENIEFSRIGTDNSDNVYICGYTTSTSGISSAGAPQLSYGGGASDGFLARFHGTGSLEWSTYYGGSASDEIYACIYSGNAVYTTGQTNSADHIATPGSFLPTGGGAMYYYQGFLAKYVNPATLYTTPTTTNADLRIYPNPARDYFILDGTVCKSDGEATVCVMNPTGETLIRQTAIVREGRINTSVDSHLLPAGLYIVEVVSSSAAYFQKLVTY